MPWRDRCCAGPRPLGARAPAATARTDEPDSTALGGGATRLGCERRSSVDCESIAARVSRIPAAMAAIVANPDIRVSIPRGIKGSDLLATLLHKHGRSGIHLRLPSISKREAGCGHGRTLNRRQDRISAAGHCADAEKGLQQAVERNGRFRSAAAS